jgi:hypothetical protein
LIGHSPQPIVVPKPVDPGEVALVIGERGSAAGSLIRKSPQFDDRGSFSTAVTDLNLLDAFITQASNSE